ncbi:MAG: restriction endonuclease subunit S, partial [Bacteroidota bacterium]
MVVEKGYKQTEVGVIPEDWEVKLLDTLTEVIDPHPSHRAPNSVYNGIPFLGIGDVNENGKIIKDNYRVVPFSVFEEHKTRYNINEGLLGLGRVASIGKVIKFRNDIGRYAVSPTMGVLRPKNCTRDYLFQILKSQFTTDYFKKIMSGSTRSSVGMIVLRKIPIPIPQNYSEQTAIANALSDMDALIAQTEKLIEKKKAIKQGVMQELLTGKNRLGDFKNKKGYKQTEVGVIPEDWGIETLGGITDKILGGGTPSRTNAAFWGTEIPWVTVKDFATFDPFKTQEYISPLGLKNSSSNLIPQGVLITATRMALG